MKKKNKLILLFLFCFLFFSLVILLFYISNNNNNNKESMKLIFFGDTMFGRKNNPFVKNPFIHVEKLIQKGDAIFFNLETTISNPPLPNHYKLDKVFNYQSNGEQLLSLRQITNKPIFVSIANNHSLDYNIKGHENTKKFLKSHNYLCNSKQKVEKNNIVFFNATDHCGCNNPKLWSDNVLMIDYNNLEPILKKVKNLKDKFIVFSVHWGSNWVKGDMPQHIQQFGKQLIDAGVNIVFGHSAHHIVKSPVIQYNNGIIIYGLGDFINDYSVKESYQSDKALLCIVHKKYNKLSFELISVQRKFVEEGGSIPFLTKS